MRSWQLFELAKTLSNVAVSINERAVVLAKYETSDGLLADKLEQLEHELRVARESLADLRRMNDSQARALHRIREALNGAGCNPLEVHARRVFAALRKAAPQHELVVVQR